MGSENHIERENFKALIEEDRIGRVEDHLKIIDTFLSTEEHVTLEDMIKLLKEKGLDYEPEFVKDCMNRWVELGFAQKKVFEGQAPRYEHRHLGKHHDHLICTKCGKIIEFTNKEMEELQLKISAKYRFHMLQHKMEIYGICNECMSQRKPVLPLSMVKTGEKVVVKTIHGGKSMKMRLTEMGIKPGVHLEIINNDGPGRIIVGIGSTRYAIGWGISQKIMVSLIN